MKFILNSFRQKKRAGCGHSANAILGEMPPFALNGEDVFCKNTPSRPLSFTPSGRVPPEVHSVAHLSTLSGWGGRERGVAKSCAYFTVGPGLPIKRHLEDATSAF